MLALLASAERRAHARRGRNQGTRVVMLRKFEHLRRDAVFDDSASLHDVDAVRDGSDHIQIMRHEQIGKV